MQKEEAERFLLNCIEKRLFINLNQMKRINWIILNVKDRTTNYGIGSYIKHFAYEMSLVSEISVFIISISYRGSSKINIQKIAGITYFNINSPFDNNGFYSMHCQKKLANGIVKIIYPYISRRILTVVHSNHVVQSFFVEELKKHFHCKTIFTQHFFYNINSEVQTFDFEKAMYTLADNIVTVTEHGKTFLLKDKNVQKNKISVIYNGLNPLCVNAKTNDTKNIVVKKYGIKFSEKLILFVGRLDEIKGIKFLTEAFGNLVKNNSDYRLLFIGEGSIDDLVLNTRSFSSNVSFLGAIPQSDVTAFYCYSDIGVIPSLEEHCSYVALEMMHYGLPLVVSKVGGLKELFQDKINALIINMVDFENPWQIAPDINSLTISMEILLKNRKMRMLFSQNLKKRSQEFTANRMIKEYLNLIR